MIQTIITAAATSLIVSLLKIRRNKNEKKKTSDGKDKSSGFVSYKSYKESKERGLSVKHLADELSKNTECFEDVVIIGIDKNKELSVSYSTGNNAKLVGFIEIAKSIIIDNINYEGD